MSQIKLKDLIKKAYEENPDQLTAAQKITPPDIDKVFQNLEQEIKAKNKRAKLSCAKWLKERSAILKKAVLLAAVILIVSTVLSAVLDTPQAKAFKFDIVKTIVNFKEHIIEITRSYDRKPEDYNSKTPVSKNIDDNTVVTVASTIGEAREKADIPILLPQKLPPGYKLDRIELEGYPQDRQGITQVYTKQDDYLIISQHANLKMAEDATIIERSSRSNVKEINIDGIKVLIISIDNQFKRAIWHQDGFKCEISGKLTEKEIAEIAANLKKSPE